MKFGFDKYVEIEGQIKMYPLPNALVKANEVPHNIGELRKYNVYGKLFKQDLNYDDFGYGHDTVDNLIEKGENFIYTILVTHIEMFKEVSDDTLYKFPTKVIDTVKKGKAKIVFSYLYEGDFYKQDDIQAVNKFVEKYGLKKNDVIVLTNNLKYKYIEPVNSNFTTVVSNYFLVNPWFTKEDFLDNKINQQSGIKLRENIEYLKTYKKPKKFLSLNRRPRVHRIILFTEIMKDPALKETSIISLGSRDLEFIGQAGFGNSWAEWYECFIPEDYKHDKQLGIDFLNKYDSSKDSFVDSNLEYNLAFNFNETLHLNTFVNVLTETLFENETIFLSEKIFKPIMGCQPFIVFGNPNTLQELQNIGFKTFNEFWDESYDSELDFSKRLSKIITILKDLVKKSDEELLEITKKMLPILQHNYEHIRFAARDEIWNLKQILDEQFNKQL
jgi:hypothetical protein